MTISGSIFNSSASIEWLLSEISETSGSSCLMDLTLFGLIDPLTFSEGGEDVFRLEANRLVGDWASTLLKSIPLGMMGVFGWPGMTRYFEWFVVGVAGMPFGSAEKALAP